MSKTSAYPLSKGDIVVPASLKGLSHEMDMVLGLNRGRGIFKFKPASKNLSILTQKIVSKISEI